MSQRADTDPRPPREEGRRGSHNEIGYRNVDEEGEHDESGGTQGPGKGDPPADEERDGD